MSFQSLFSHGYLIPEMKNKRLFCLPVPLLCCIAEAGDSGGFTVSPEMKRAAAVRCSRMEPPSPGGTATRQPGSACRNCPRAGTQSWPRKLREALVCGGGSCRAQPLWPQWDTGLSAVISGLLWAAGAGKQALFGFSLQSLQIFVLILKKVLTRLF